MYLHLVNPTNAELGEGTAYGMIKNSDPLPKAMLARFGRATAIHVVDHIDERLAARCDVGIKAPSPGRSCSEAGRPRRR